MLFACHFLPQILLGPFLNTMTQMTVLQILLKRKSDLQRDICLCFFGGGGGGGEGLGGSGGRFKFDLT